MKGGLLVASLLLGLLASTVSAGAAPNATSARSNCGARGLTFYFWPQGHPAIPSIGFPAFATPHMEVYTSAGKQVGYIDSTGASGFAKSCKAARDLPARWEGKTHKTISATMLVKCSLPAAAEMKGTKAAGAGQLIVTAGHTTKVVVSASMKPTGSTLTYDTRYCKTFPAPAPPKPSMYAFSGLTVSFDAQFASGGPTTHVTYTFSGTMCGDPATTPWTVAVSSTVTNAFNRTVALLPGVSTSMVAFVVGNPEQGRITMSLTFTSSPPQMTATAEPSGVISNVGIGAPAAVTVTPVAACP